MDKRVMSNQKIYIVETRDIIGVGRKKKKYIGA
jgi:hypothetical protein